MNKKEEKIVDDAQKALEAARAAQRPQGVTYHKVPSGVLAAARQILGQLPYDQVGKLCNAIDTQCVPLEE